MSIGYKVVPLLSLPSYTGDVDVSHSKPLLGHPAMMKLTDVVAHGDGLCKLPIRLGL